MVTTFMANEFETNYQTQVPRGQKKHVIEHLRQPEGIEVPDIEHNPVKYFSLALVHLRNVLARIPVMIEDHSRPVDEYRVQTLTPEATSSMTVQPQWETAEIITSIVIIGPAGAVTVQLGDRTWNLTIPAAGILVIAPIALILGRSDNRILSSATPGEYNMELMGYADTRAEKV
jgi:hypothetical protein